MGRISACILTKNEEKNIGRCLQNIAPYVDEIVIVDGFSEDKTVEIARKYTDKIYQKEFSGSCLLYTSPSPRDLSTSRMPSSA